ncbi:MAG: KTSC domain-containing protein [Gemmatimonadaceae bacterium]
MERRTIFSSSIRSIGFDRDAQVLELEFYSGGIYQYREVPESVYDEFMLAPSKGKFYQHRIKEKFDYSRVGWVECE